MTWQLAIPCLLISLGALFIIAALLDARARSRRLRRFAIMTFRTIPRSELLKMRNLN